MISNFLNCSDCKYFLRIPVSSEFAGVYHIRVIPVRRVVLKFCNKINSNFQLLTEFFKTKSTSKLNFWNIWELKIITCIGIRITATHFQVYISFNYNCEITEQQKKQKNENQLCFIRIDCPLWRHLYDMMKTHLPDSSIKIFHVLLSNSS